jgi:hypothetical protein
MGALWGPLHGGANQAVLEMLEEIQKAGGDMQKILAMAKDKNSGFRLMGFGHRVYKNFDPRSRILMAACDKVLKEIGVQDPLLELAKKLYPQFEVLQLGRGFVKIMGDKKPFTEHVEAAQAALQLTRERMLSGQYDVIILDEVIYALGYLDFRLIELKDVLQIIREKPLQLHLIQILLLHFSFLHRSCQFQKPIC